MLSWKVADKSDPPDVQLTDYGWKVKEHEHVMPATSSGAAAKRRAKSVVEGVVMDPMECGLLATVSAKEACLM